ncbi:hypothetical protein Thiowin_02193 [Thiorhodovibrio winogradskyi]|uniref:Ice-binding protein C-terminal domain-containing protein n=1 Tax=Thiorhodovibrio winogradskyi TaxID=77007 RepID=A0ABZ0S9S8_9GAMM|nr:hypothetical protein [Thiorhodovibrio winogradskyi]
MKRLVLPIASLLSASGLFGVQGAYAGATYSTDFENFALGSNTTTAPLVGAVDGWRGNGTSGTVGGTVDAEIVELSSGNQVFRISNGIGTSGNYDFTHPATPTIDAAGESSLTGDTIDTFNFSFDFMSAFDGEQDGLQIDVTPFEGGTASRQGIVRIQDGGTDGFRVGWWEVNSGFNFLTLGTGLDRNVWHNLSVSMIFNDGPSNDVVTLTLNGASTTSTSWEQYYSTAGTPQPALAPVDSVIFRVPTACSSLGTCNNVADNGVYFDNFTQSSSSSAVPVPPTLTLIGLGLAGLGYSLRKKS